MFLCFISCMFNLQSQFDMWNFYFSRSCKCQKCQKTTQTFQELRKRLKFKHINGLLALHVKVPQLFSLYTLQRPKSQQIMRKLQGGSSVKLLIGQYVRNFWRAILTFSTPKGQKSPGKIFRSCIQHLIFLHIFCIAAFAKSVQTETEMGLLFDQGNAACKSI